MNNIIVMQIEGLNKMPKAMQEDQEGATIDLKLISYLNCVRK